MRVLDFQCQITGFVSNTNKQMNLAFGKGGESALKSGLVDSK
jgi:hypothetical protein